MKLASSLFGRAAQSLTTAVWNLAALPRTDHRSRGTKIVLLNVSPDSNRGACALTWASLDFVFSAFPQAVVAIEPTATTPADPAPFRHTMRRYPDVKILPPLFAGEGKPTFVLLCRFAKSLSEVLRFNSKRHNQNPTLEWIRNCELAVSVGGVNFETYGGTLRGDARFIVRTLALLAAQKINVPSVFVGAQLGPFNSQLGRSLFRRVAAQAAAVFPRDRISASEVQSKMAHPRCILMPDSAFSLKVSVTAGQLFDNCGLDANAATLALVISSALRLEEGSDVHVDLFARIARRLVESNVVTQIVVMIQCDEDRAISRKLSRSLQLDPRCCIDADYSPDQLSNFYGACRMVISSRMHAVILAMLAGVPAISLAPEVTFKEHAVLELLGLDSLCVPTRLGSDHAADVCLGIAAEEDRHRRAVVGAVGAARTQLEEVPQYLREVVEEARRSSRATYLDV